MYGPLARFSFKRVVLQQSTMLLALVHHLRYHMSLAYFERDVLKYAFRNRYILEVCLVFTISGIIEPAVLAFVDASVLSCYVWSESRSHAKCIAQLWFAQSGRRRAAGEKVDAEKER